MHDVVNVFMCTGYTRATNEYFMKSEPGTARRLHRAVRGDRPAGGTVRLPRRRLRRRAFQRQRARLLAAAGGDLPPRATSTWRAGAPRRRVRTAAATGVG